MNIASKHIQIQAAGITSPPCFGGLILMKTSANDKVNEPDKDEVQSGRLLIGKTVYFVNVHFGKIPLEDILKNRILNDTKRM